MRQKICLAASEHQSFMSALGHWTWCAHAQVNCTGNGLMQQLDPKLDGYLGIMDVLTVTGIAKTRIMCSNI